jgi:ketosteroid isomerase-like protein
MVLNEVPLVCHLTRVVLIHTVAKPRNEVVLLIGGNEMKARVISIFAAVALVMVFAISGSYQLKADGHTVGSMTKKVLDEHLAAFGSGNVDAIVSHYAPDAVIMVPGGVKRGHVEIRAMFEGLVKEFGQPGVTFEMLNSDVDGEIALIVWKAETGKAVYDMGTDTFIVRDGKIVTQTLAAKATMK